jgi:hypothetical protein
MSPGEYVATFASIILGLAVADLATSFLRLLKAPGPVKWDWIPLLVALHVLLAIIQYWWSSYDTWQRAPSIGIFLIPLVSMILIFLVASAALPDEVPEKGINLRDHYFGYQKFFWGLFAAYVASTSVGRIVHLVVTGTVRNPPVFVYTFVSMGLMILLMFSKRRWVHGAVVVVLTVTPLVRWMSQTVR